jgi:hypothetical protein
MMKMNSRRSAPAQLWRGSPLTLWPAPAARCTRPLATPSASPAAPIGKWWLTSLQQRLVKTGGRLIKHARYCWLLLAESHLTRRLFAGMLRKIAPLPSPAG